MLRGLIATKAALAPEGRRIYAIGDIHGRADLLDQLLGRIDEDRQGGGYSGRAALVLLGDYIDRGPQSRDVVDRVLRLKGEGYELHCLKGNHEQALLDFLEWPETGQAWLEFGGRQTFYSYGVQPPPSMAKPAELKRGAEALAGALPEDHVKFFRSLSMHIRLGDYLFVHAGLRPGKTLDAQAPSDLMEIREPFLSSRHRWPFVVVHGHTPVEQVHRDVRRIALDTGAYATGRLSAVRLVGAEVDFLST
jgi:serine/threonine protein phosphatase 1